MNNKTLFGKIIILLFLAFSCTEQDLIKQEANYQPQNSFVETHVSYVDDNVLESYHRSLQYIGGELLKISSYKAVFNRIDSLLKQKYNDEHQVLLKTIFNNAEIFKGSNLSSKSSLLESSTDYDDRLIDINLDDFTIGPKNEDFKYDLQLYEPYFGTTKIHETFGIVLVINDYSEKNEVDGFYLEDQQLKKIEFKIIEDFAKKYKVWVIGTNEDSEIDNTSSNNLRTTVNPSSFYLDKIKIDDHKENWISGDNDVRILSYSTWYPEGSAIYWVGKPDRQTVVKIDGSQISQWINLAYDFNYYPNWDPVDGNYTGAKGDNFVGLVYEHDNWPAPYRGIQCWLVNPSCPYVCVFGNTVNISFRSSNSPFFLMQQYYNYIGVNTKYKWLKPDANEEVSIIGGGFKTYKNP